MEALELEVTGGPAAGLRISAYEDFRVGSAEDGAAALGGDRWLSPAHAAFQRGQNGWAVEDLRSVEGTKVNGRAVRGGPVALAPGDVVELGSSRLAIGHPGDAGSAGGAGVEGGGAGSPPPHGYAAARDGENRRELDARRLLALVIDSLAVAAATLPVFVAAHGRVVFIVALAAVGLTYFFVCESLTGQTLGKRITGLRVVRTNGAPLTPGKVAGRTVLRIVDQQVACLVGMLAMIVTGRRRQRLGDLAAGTAVTRAAAPAPRPNARGRHRLVLWLYPCLWLAPAVLLFVLVPESRLQPCSEARISAWSGNEGSCMMGENEVLDVVNAGHTLRVPGLNVRLLATETRDVGARRLGAGAREAGPLTVVAFKLRVHNTSGRRLRFNLGRRPRAIGLSVPRPDGSLGLLTELPARVRAGFKPFSSPIGAGRTRVAWARFAIRREAVPYVREQGVGLVLLPRTTAAGIAHIGQIRLWRASNRQGMRALAGLAH